MSRTYRVAIVGATGLVGMEMRAILEERGFPVSDLKLLASERSEGEVQSFHGEAVRVSALEEDSLEDVDFAFFSAGEEVSKKFAPLGAKAGAVVIDNSAAWRMDPEVPLVVPEVNPHQIQNHKGIIANPNCSTIQLVVALAPLHREAVLKRLVVSTYQSVSGMGKEALDELLAQSVQLANFQSVTLKTFRHQMAFNVLPHCGSIRGDHTSEELKLVHETRKILEEPQLKVAATAVRVPVFIGHGESVFAEFENPMTPERAREIWEKSAGLQMRDNLEQEEYPMPVDAAGQDDVYVGRLRQDTTVDSGLSFFVVGDNLRKGAATNAIQIAEHMISQPDSGF